MRQISGQFYRPVLGKGIKRLLIAIGSVFVVQVISATFGKIYLERIFGFTPVSFLSGWIWQLFTYPFLHGGIWHILFNCLTLYLIGAELERRWGTRPFIKYYMVCAVGGAILQILAWLVAMAFSLSAADFLGTVPIIGASGALYGLLMAFGVLYGDNYILVMFLFPMKARNFVILLGIIEIISAISNSDGSSGIAHLVHLGGLVTGFLYLKWKGPNLDGRGGFRRQKRMNPEELRQRLRVIANDEKWN